MNSKVLTNEYELDFGDGIKIYYGAQDIRNPKVISITTKGKFTPTEKLKDYKPNIKIAKKEFNSHANEILQKVNWIEPHYIFTSDFTECGIAMGKACKWKFHIYIMPKEIKHIIKYELPIVKLSETITDALEFHFSLKGFKIL